MRTFVKPFDYCLLKKLDFYFTKGSYFPLPVFLTANAFLFELFEICFFISFFEFAFVFLLPKNLLVIIILLLNVQIIFIRNQHLKNTLTYFVTLRLKFFKR